MGRNHITGSLLWLLLMTAAACGKKEAPAEPVIRPVRVVRVTPTDAGRLRMFSGTARAGVESRLSFKVAGNIKRLAVHVGDRVKKGDLIAELDARDYDLRLEQARASLAQTNAQLRNAKAAYGRTRELYASRSASKSEFDIARAAAESAEASVGAASKQVQLARQQRQYTRLSAPVAGNIAATKVEVNENVGAGQVVALLSSGQDIEVLISVPEALIAQIKKGSQVAVRFDALPKSSFPATVAEVGVSSVEASTTFPVTVKLGRKHDAIRAGMAAEVTFEFGDKNAPPRILIPAVAVGEDQKGRFVYVASPTEAGFGQVKRREVKVGELTGTGLEIESGLRAGDIVVTAGLRFLEDGRKVRLPAEEKK